MRNVNLFLAFVKYECIVKSVIKRIPDFIVQKQFTAFRTWFHFVCQIIRSCVNSEILNRSNKEFFQSSENGDYGPLKYFELEMIGSLNLEMLYRQN